ncbi:bifunctional precorrin-2 dehydrogenase/sirohydrochlorin ferrochelatase [Chloroflexota bacterium]
MGDRLDSTTFYPLFLIVKGKRCVVVGGGEVALRKARVLLKHGADVEVVSPELRPEMLKMASAGMIKASKREFQPADLENAVIVIAATDKLAVNKRVAVEAQRRRVLVNVVDNPKLCDFIVPSIIYRGDLTIAISTGGKSPALSRAIREKLEKLLAEEYDLLTTLIAEVRSEMKIKGRTADKDKWQMALNLDDLIKLLKDGQRKEAKASLLKRLM